MRTALGAFSCRQQQVSGEGLAKCQVGVPSVQAGSPVPLEMAAVGGHRAMPVPAGSGWGCHHMLLAPVSVWGLLMLPMVRCRRTCAAGTRTAPGGCSWSDTWTMRPVGHFSACPRWVVSFSPAVSTRACDGCLLLAISCSMTVGRSRRRAKLQCALSSTGRPRRCADLGSQLLG